MKPQLLIWLSGLIVPILIIVTASPEDGSRNAAAPPISGGEKRRESGAQTPKPSRYGALAGRLAAPLVAIAFAAWLSAKMIQHFCSCTALANFDSFIAHIAHQYRAPTTWHAMRCIAVLGSPQFTAAIVIVTGIAMRAWMKTWRPLAILVLVYAGVVGLEVALKLTVVRAALRSASGIVTGRHVSSFPSGHSMRAAGIYGAMAYLFGPLHRRWIVGLWMGAVSMALIVGISVVYLGWHRATDAIGGWTLGAAWLLVVISEMAKRRWRGERIEGLPAMGAKPFARR